MNMSLLRHAVYPVWYTACLYDVLYIKMSAVSITVIVPFESQGKRECGCYMSVLIKCKGTLKCMNVCLWEIIMSTTDQDVKTLGLS